MSNGQHNAIVFDQDIDFKQRNQEMDSNLRREPLFLVPKESFKHRIKQVENPYHRNLFSVQQSFNRRSFLFPVGNYSRYKMCNNCFIINFDFLIENDICANKNFTLVYLVFTKYSNIAQRTALRKTWLSDVRTSKNQTYIFVTGRGPQSENVHIENMIRENNEYKDILLVDFLDSYSNLTYKTVMAFKWITRRCPQTEFVMKVDDDVWVHKPILMMTLRHKKFRFGGYCMFNSSPFRNMDSKYYASYESFPERVYPPFCSGTAYLTKIDVIQKILLVSPNVTFFHLEDVYMALCLRELRIGVSTIRGFNAHKILASNCLNKSPFVITSHGFIPEEMKQIWQHQCNFERRMRKGLSHMKRQSSLRREWPPHARAWNYVRMNANSNKSPPKNSLKRHPGRH
ncbi:beta-1,3-galactosyltransferase 1-like [Ylistrum balloti]|uniref:beta-1,3-galactosyltransferase 1-like n=1 Tax=Ylistrum balloti TaxID=509963 RepID=UPI002905E966|nr:beta-1,3-galactosyltransferase 1-like [Ylistrum balloti]